MILNRDLYLERLYKHKDKDLVKIITGIRRCGKSTLLFDLYHKRLLEDGIPDDHIIKVAIDNIKNADLKEPAALYKYLAQQMQGKGRDKIVVKLPGMAAPQRTGQAHRQQAAEPYPALPAARLPPVQKLRQRDKAEHKKRQLSAFLPDIGIVIRRNKNQHRRQNLPPGGGKARFFRQNGRRKFSGGQRLRLF